MKNIKVILLIISTVLLCSCATTEKRQLKNTNGKVLVVTGFPNTFHVNVIGTTAFTNHHNKFSDLDFEADDLILAAVENNNKGRKFEPYYGNIAFDFSKGHWYTGNGFNIKKSIPQLKKINSEFNSRYIILIGSENLYDSIYGTNQFHEGVGITRRYTFGNPSTVLYVSMKMALVDTETYKIVKSIDTLKYEFTNELKAEKLHKLDREKFLIFQDKYSHIFRKAFNELINDL